MYVQGNETSSQEDVNAVLSEVIDTIKRFCGGDSTIIQEEIEIVNPVSMMQ